MNSSVGPFEPGNLLSIELQHGSYRQPRSGLLATERILPLTRYLKFHLLR
jgi:hypothetical protein